MFPLSNLPLGCRGCVAQIDGGRQLAHRLRGLGLRVGSEVEMLHRKGQGVVVSVGETRVALGAGVAEKLLIDPVTPVGMDGGGPIHHD